MKCFRANKSQRKIIRRQYFENIEYTHVFLKQCFVNCIFNVESSTQFTKYNSVENINFVPKVNNKIKIEFDTVLESFFQQMNNG